MDHIIKIFQILDIPILSPQNIMYPIFGKMNTCYVGLCFWLLVMVVKLTLLPACVTVLNSQFHSSVVTTAYQ